MIFQHTWRQVLDGTKTQTRRVCKPGEEEYHGRFHERIDTVIQEVVVKGRTKWAISRTYAVQPGRGQKAVGRIRITAIRRQDVREISDEDVKAEGFETRADFLRLWEQMHGAQYEAWALTFEVVK